MIFREGVMGPKDDARKNILLIFDTFPRTRSLNGWFIADEDRFMGDVINASGVFVIRTDAIEGDIFTVLMNKRGDGDRAISVVDDVVMESSQVLATTLLKKPMGILSRSSNWTRTRPYAKNEKERDKFIDAVIDTIFQSSNIQLKEDAQKFVLSVLQNTKSKNMQDKASLLAQELPKWCASNKRSP